MKVPVTVETHEEEYRRTPRPRGNRISYSQLKTPCDLRLKFKRDRVKVVSPTGIVLLYGRAFHAGIEAYLRGSAKTPAVAVTAALAALRTEISRAEERGGIRWDEYHERNLDGSPSLKGSNFGRLPDPSFCRFWLEQQVPLWILVMGRLKLLYSEKSLYVPLTPQPGWKEAWSLESWLDFVVDHEPGWSIVDTKTTGSPWDASDVRENSVQAHLYMLAAFREWGDTEPAAPFQFHVLPRTKDSLHALEIAREWMQGEIGTEAALEALRTGGPVVTKEVTVTKATKSTKAVKEVRPVLREDGTPEQEWTLEDAMQVVEVPFSLERGNIYVKGVIRPTIAKIEAGAMAASPVGWHCSPKFCDYWDHCAFGEGSHL